MAMRPPPTSSMVSRPGSSHAVMLKARMLTTSEMSARFSSAPVPERQSQSSWISVR